MPRRESERGQGVIVGDTWRPDTNTLKPVGNVGDFRPPPDDPAVRATPRWGQQVRQQIGSSLGTLQELGTQYFTEKQNLGQLKELFSRAPASDFSALWSRRARQHRANMAAAAASFYAQTGGEDIESYGFGRSFTGGATRLANVVTGGTRPHDPRRPHRGADRRAFADRERGFLGNRYGVGGDIVTSQGG